MTFVRCGKILNVGVGLVVAFLHQQEGTIGRYSGMVNGIKDPETGCRCTGIYNWQLIYLGLYQGAVQTEENNMVGSPGKLEGHTKKT